MLSVQTVGAENTEPEKTQVIVEMLCGKPVAVITSTAVVSWYLIKTNKKWNAWFIDIRDKLVSGEMKGSFMQLDTECKCIDS